MKIVLDPKKRAALTCVWKGARTLPLLLICILIAVFCFYRGTFAFSWGLNFLGGVAFVIGIPLTLLALDLARRSLFMFRRAVGIWVTGKDPFSAGAEDQALRLRNEAMRLRIMGQFDAAYRAYRQALPLYEKLGDVDAQCNVLCSLAETTASRDERSILVGQIQALCDGIQDPQERERALRNLEALRQRLSEHPL